MSSKKMPPTPAPPPTEEEMRFGDELAVLPIRNAVLFPGAVAPFDVGREKSVALVEEVHNQASPVIAIFAQRDPATDDPSADDLYPVGCAARVRCLFHGRLAQLHATACPTIRLADDSDDPSELM